MPKYLLCLCLLITGCAVPSSQSIAAWNHGQFHAQFGISITQAGQTIPLQGGVELDDLGGRVGFILPHGRTLGYCQYIQQSIECNLSVPQNKQAQILLQQSGLALYRVLIHRKEQTTERAWTVLWTKTTAPKDTLKALYTNNEQGVSAEIQFTEIR